MNSIQKINRFYKTAVKPEVCNVENNLCLTDFQYDIYERRYLKKQDINFIADKLCCSRTKINTELKHIRAMILKLI